MDAVLQPFEPTGDWFVWVGNLILLIAGSTALIWVIAFLCARLKVFGAKDAELRVWFGWMIGFLAYALLSTVFLLANAVHYRNMDIALEYCFPYLLVTVIASAYGLHLRALIARKLADLTNTKGG